MKNSQQLITIPLESVNLEGELILPFQTPSLVVFAHGSGSSRHSARNQYVAKTLQTVGIGTLLFDLLTEQEDSDPEVRFHIALLSKRLTEVTRWLTTQPQTKNLAIGYFGASTGAGAALISAAELGKKIGCVVSRGGRPDLAQNFLPQVQSPTLLIVGENDEVVIELNKKAYKLLQAEKDLVVIPGATHLFEEPGALEDVAHVAALWFQRYLSGQKAYEENRYF